MADGKWSRLGCALDTVMIVPLVIFSVIASDHYVHSSGCPVILPLVLVPPVKSDMSF